MPVICSYWLEYPRLTGEKQTPLIMQGSGKACPVVKSRTQVCYCHRVVFACLQDPDSFQRWNTRRRHVPAQEHNHIVWQLIYLLSIVHLLIRVGSGPSLATDGMRFWS